MEVQGWVGTAYMWCGVVCRVGNLGRCTVPGVGVVVEWCSTRGVGKRVVTLVPLVSRVGNTLEVVLTMPSRRTTHKQWRRGGGG